MPIVKGILRKCRNKAAAFIRGESGQSLVASALLFAVIMGAAALAVDLGASYAVKQKLQNAADAAAIAGARKLPDVSAAVRQARDFAEQNGVSMEDTKVTAPYGGSRYRIEVVCSRKKSYAFAGVFGRDEGNVSARAVAECQPMRGPFDYAIFSGDDDYELPFNVGNMTVNGSIHSNDDAALRSSGLTVNGSVETVNQLFINGGVTINGDSIAAKVIRDGRTIVTGESGPFVEMPDFTDTIRAAAERAGTYYSSSQQFYGDGVCVDDPIFVEGDVSFSSPTVISGSGVIIATGNITFNAASILAPNASVCFYSKNGNIQVNAGEIRVDGLLYAPNGMIQANTSSFIVNGRVVGNRLQFNSSQVQVNQGEHDRDCLPRTEICLIE